MNKDDRTALLLSPEGDGYVHLYSLPLGSFDIAGLQPLAAYQRTQTDQPAQEIIYMPE